MTTAATTDEQPMLPIQILMAKVMNDLKVLPKGERFGGGRGMDSFSFRGVDSTINAVGPVFRRYGIVGPVPTVVDVSYETVPIGKDRNPTGFARVKVVYEFFGPKGDVLTCTVPGEAMDRGDKALAKAMSVAMRIALLQVLCLPTETDDPDSEQFDRGGEGSGHARSLPAPSPADTARAKLLAEVEKRHLNPGNVAKQYLEEIGTAIQDETSAERIENFTFRLVEEG